MTGRYVYDVDPVDGEEAWAFFEACRDGDLEGVRGLIRRDPALVHAQYWYTQPIHFAVYANRPAAVRALLDAGAEPGRVRFMDSGWKKLVRRARTMGFDEVKSILEAEARARFGYDPRFVELRGAMVAAGQAAGRGDGPRPAAPGRFRRPAGQQRGALGRHDPPARPSAASHRPRRRPGRLPERRTDPGAPPVQRRLRVPRVAGAEGDLACRTRPGPGCPRGGRRHPRPLGGLRLRRPGTYSRVTGRASRARPPPRLGSP